MATLAQTEIVKLPSTAAVWRRWPVVEVLRNFDIHKWLTTMAALGAFLLICIQQIIGAGGLFAANSADMTHFQGQLNSLTVLVSRLSDKLDQVPRADQIVVLDRHLSAQDGRMDSIDTRLRDSESRIAALRAQLDLIDQSSRAMLGHK